MCVISTDSPSDMSILTSNNYLELIYQAVTNILDTFGDDYPDLDQFQVSQSIDFIAEYDEDDYQNILNEMLCYLASQGIHCSAKMIAFDYEIEENNLISITQDML